MHWVEKAFNNMFVMETKKLKINKVRDSHLTQICDVMFLRTSLYRQHQAVVIWCNIDPDPGPGLLSPLSLYNERVVVTIAFWVTLMLYNPMLNRKLGLL